MSAARAAHIDRPSREVRGRKRELYRERCKDSDGNTYCVIVWQMFRGLAVTSYTLEDGTPAKYIDGCKFEIVSTGKVISRCDEPAPEGLVLS
ncbi:hypothetical protein [Bosea vaviloviae]|uniref:Uncharacterized protein n=1 Tax=Bosea vaviloviae TaxID=1526658 RepID=A0A1D7U057_9HYPH|nr:hypothetical protein [Bosea vaviloviae]AOO80736.1 hypothetical protein BHK69_09895 [Bosea vaviloviae]